MLEFSEGEKEQIQRWADNIEGDITIRYATADHPADDAFSDYMGRFVALAPCAKVKKNGDTPVERPTLFVDNRVAYQALPSDRELEPFLTALKKRERFAEQIPDDLRENLNRLDLPALIKVYITPHCPFCPLAVSTLLGLSAISDQVRLTVIDGELFADAAQQDRVTAAPTVILDDQFRWTGSIDAGELVTMMLDRDPANLGAEALRGMIEEGDAQGVSDMMRKRGQIFPSFLQLLAHPRWSVRLGAMVVFETLAEDDPALAGQIVQPVTDLYDSVDDVTQGDLLHVLGESGNRGALSFLKQIVQGDVNDEVRAAAEEAIEKLM